MFFDKPRLNSALRWSDTETSKKPVSFREALDLPCQHNTPFKLENSNKENSEEEIAEEENPEVAKRPLCGWRQPREVMRLLGEP